MIEYIELALLISVIPLMIGVNILIFRIIFKEFTHK